MATTMAEVEFEFDLIFALPEGTDEGLVLDSLHDAGCSDAAVGLGRAGLVGLGFTRTGRDPEAVVSATVDQAMSGLPDGTVLREVRPELVSLAEVAARLK